MAMPARPAGFPAGPFLDSYDFADPKGGRMAPDQLVGAPFDARVFPRPGGSGNVPRARAPRRRGAIVGPGVRREAHRRDAHRARRRFFPVEGFPLADGARAAAPPRPQRPSIELPRGDVPRELLVHFGEEGFINDASGSFDDDDRVVHRAAARDAFDSHPFSFDKVAVERPYTMTVSPDASFSCAPRMLPGDWNIDYVPVTPEVSPKAPAAAPPSLDKVAVPRVGDEPSLKRPAGPDDRPAHASKHVKVEPGAEDGDADAAPPDSEFAFDAPDAGLEGLDAPEGGDARFASFRVGDFEGIGGLGEPVGEPVPMPEAKAEPAALPAAAPAAAAAAAAPAADGAAPVPGPKYQGYVGAYSPEARKVRIAAFLKKRERRVWTKKVKYDVRKNFADSRMRVKGRFVKKEDEDLLRELVSCV